MEFDTPEEFLQVFGENALSSTLCKYLGVNHKSPERMLKKLGIQMSEQVEHPAWWDHLPSLPSFTTVKHWARGTIYRIDCVTAGDSPGYLSVLLHTTTRRYENQLLETDDE